MYVLLCHSGSAGLHRVEEAEGSGEEEEPSVCLHLLTARPTLGKMIGTAPSYLSKSSESML